MQHINEAAAARVASAGPTCRRGSTPRSRSRWRRSPTRPLPSMDDFCGELEACLAELRRGVAQPARRTTARHRRARRRGRGSARERRRDPAARGAALLGLALLARRRLGRLDALGDGDGGSGAQTGTTAAAAAADRSAPAASARTTPTAATASTTPRRRTRPTATRPRTGRPSTTTNRPAIAGKPGVGLVLDAGGRATSTASTS